MRYYCESAQNKEYGSLDKIQTEPQHEFAISKIFNDTATCYFLLRAALDPEYVYRLEIVVTYTRPCIHEPA